MPSVVLIYVHGLRPLGARRQTCASTGARSTRTPWQRVCSHFSSGLDAAVERTYTNALGPGVHYERWSYLDDAAAAAAAAGDCTSDAKIDTKADAKADAKSKADSVSVAARALAAHVERRYGAAAGWRVVLLGHSFGGVLALRAALHLPHVRVITVASPHNGAALVRAASALCLGRVLRAVYGDIVGELEARYVSVLEKALLHGRHLNVVCTNWPLAFDWRLFASDQVVYGAGDGCAGGASEIWLSGTRHTRSLAADRRIVDSVVAAVRSW